MIFRRSPVLNNLWPQLFWADRLVSSVSTTDLADSGHGIEVAVVGHRLGARLHNIREPRKGSRGVVAVAVISWPGLHDA